MSAIKETPASVEAVKEDVVVPTTIVEPTEGPQTIPQSETMPAVEEAPAVPATTGTATADSVVAPDTTETSDMISAPAPVSLALPESTETPKVVVDAPHIDAKEEVKEEVKKSPKKEKKGLFARISGIFSSSPEKKEKIAKAEKPTTVDKAVTSETAAAPTSSDPVVDTTTAEVPSSTAAIVEPTKVEEPLAVQSAGDKLAEEVNALKIEEETKKETEIKPVTEDAVAAPVDAEIATTPAVAPTEKKDEAEIKPSNSAPKMHRRISARIGQYIDTKFGDKKEKTATTAKKEKKAHKEKKEDGSSSSSEDEAKKQEAPVLAAPLAMEPLGEVVTEADAVESKQEDKIEEAPKPIVVA